MHYAGEDGWTVIKDSRHGKRQRSNKKKKVVMHGISQVLYDQTSFSNQQHVFKQSQTANSAKQLVRSWLQLRQPKSKEWKIHVEALGLGDIYREKKPRLQFYLLKTLLEAISTYNRTTTVNVYDPVFDKNCRLMLSQLNFQSSSNPLQQSYDLNQDTLCIFYMPHCQKHLYEKVLTSNIHHGRLLVIGNSLGGYKQREVLLNQPKTAIFELVEMRQTRLADYDGAFNDTYFMSKE